MNDVEDELVGVVESTVFGVVEATVFGLDSVIWSVVGAGVWALVVVADRSSVTDTADSSIPHDVAATRPVRQVTATIVR